VFEHIPTSSAHLSGPRHYPPPMAFGYSFTLSLDNSQKQQRRQSLERYALIAQISLLAVLVAIRIYFVLSWFGNRWMSGGEDARPSSRHVKYDRLTLSTSWLEIVRRYWRRWRWWLGEPVMVGWGTTGEWLAGGVWMAWLLLLSYLQTVPGKAFQIERSLKEHLSSRSSG